MNEMCMSCGCKQVNDDHGDPRNLTMDNLQQAADAAGISVDEAAKNIQASAGEKTPVGAGAAGTGQTDGQARGQQSGYTGQQGGSTGGSQPESDGQNRGHESESASGQEKPFSEKERTEREF